MNDALQIRRSSDADRSAVQKLLRASLNWGDDPRSEALFNWKHARNPFGPSPSWVALDGERVVGFRALLLWEFTRGDATVRAARPVDTATHPDYQGRGIFTRLTTHALRQLSEDGVELIFNTPNSKSRPGYLKMGWESLGRLPAVARPTRTSRSLHMLRARAPADRWTVESAAGAPATHAFDDDAGVRSLLTRLRCTSALRTRLSPEFLRWRYGDPLLGYRTIAAPTGVADGIAIFRVRRRGMAREAALCEVLAPRDDLRTARGLVRAVMAASEADYVLGIRTDCVPLRKLWRLPGQGPRLTARTLSGASPPPRREWSLSLGDIELF